ncbi:MAG: type II toxin-antitoxin system HicA family toxin [Actinobacteria bacterium]|nr:type II toxin-antitoxin system HicA family toxin [Actinomycetota bacterium]
MKQISGKDFCRLLTDQGWSLARVKGSHHIFFKEGVRDRIVVPVHGNRPLKIGLLKSQMKVAGIQESDL